MTKNEELERLLQRKQSHRHGGDHGNNNNTSYTSGGNFDASYDAEDRRSNDNSFSLAQAKQETMSIKAQVDSLLMEKTHMQESLMQAEASAMDLDRELASLKG